MPALYWKFAFPLLSLASFAYPSKHDGEGSLAPLFLSGCPHPGAHSTLGLALSEHCQTVSLPVCFSSSFELLKGSDCIFCQEILSAQ